MDLDLLGPLVALALIDSTSFGTLLIPIWLMLHPGPLRAARVLVFLGTVAVFYFAVGVAMAAGASALLPNLAEIVDSRPFRWVQLTVGVALFFLSFRMGRKKDGGNKENPEAGTGRLARWRERAPTTGSVGGLIALALTAVAIELGSMLPYLAAIGLITTAQLPIAQIVVIMAGYCLVMILPALILLGTRLAIRHRIEPLLQRISHWLASSETLAWVVGIVGFLLARDAAFRLGLFDEGFLGFRFGDGNGS
ncbi:MAG: GAP family protein [Micromonosporaceae bacterium]|nr:GAP family protein [Micromonosporaceae bacterium]